MSDQDYSSRFEDLRQIEAQAAQDVEAPSPEHLPPVEDNTPAPAAVLSPEEAVDIVIPEEQVESGPAAPVAPAAPAPKQEPVQFSRPRSLVMEMAGEMDNEFGARGPEMGEDEDESVDSVLVAGEGAEEEEVNSFDQLRDHSAEMLRRRLPRARLPKLRGLVIGGAIIALAYGASKNDWVQERTQQTSVAQSAGEIGGFQTLRTFVRSAVRFSESEVVGAAGPEYQEGADFASYMLTGEMLKRVSDPQARLAILSVNLERAIQRKDLAGVVESMGAIEALPGYKDDVRAHVLRQKGYEFLVQNDLHQNVTQAVDWQRRARVSEQEANDPDNGLTVKGAGWNEEVASQVREAMVAAASASVQNRLSDKGKAGYIGLLKQAGEKYNVAVSLTLEGASSQVARRR